MPDHSTSKLSTREMVRAHAYPVLAAVSTLALVVIAACLLPIARQADHLNRCVADPAVAGCLRLR